MYRKCISITVCQIPNEVKWHTPSDRVDKTCDEPINGHLVITVRYINMFTKFGFNQDTPIKETVNQNVHDTKWHL